MTEALLTKREFVFLCRAIFTSSNKGGAAKRVCEDFLKGQVADEPTDDPMSELEIGSMVSKLAGITGGVSAGKTS